MTTPISRTCWTASCSTICSILLSRDRPLCLCVACASVHVLFPFCFLLRAIVVGFVFGRFVFRGVGLEMSTRVFTVWMMSTVDAELLRMMRTVGMLGDVWRGN